MNIMQSIISCYIILSDLGPAAGRPPGTLGPRRRAGAVPHLQGLL